MSEWNLVWAGDGQIPRVDGQSGSGFYGGTLLRRVIGCIICKRRLFCFAKKKYIMCYFRHWFSIVLWG